MVVELKDLKVETQAEKEAIHRKQRGTILGHMRKVQESNLVIDKKRIMYRLINLMVELGSSSTETLRQTRLDRIKVDIEKMFELGKGKYFHEHDTLSMDIRIRANKLIEDILEHAYPCIKDKFSEKLLGIMEDICQEAIEDACDNCDQRRYDG